MRFAHQTRDRIADHKVSKISGVFLSVSFYFSHSSPGMDLPAVQLLCLEQMGRSLEDHTRDFLDLACLTHFPDRSLCVFYITSLSEQCKARLPADSPKENFTACVEWVLENNGLFFSVCPVEDNSSPTPEPEPSQPPPSRCTECSPEPTAAAEPEPAAIKEPTPFKVTEPLIAPESGLKNVTDQVYEPATLCIMGIIVEIEGMEDNPAHTPTTEGELLLDSELLDCLNEEFWLLPFLLVPFSSPEPLLVPSSSPEPLLVPPSTSSSASSSTNISRRFPPRLPLPPPLYQPASPSALSRLPQESPSAHPQHAMSGGSVVLRDFLSPATSGLEDPQSLPSRPGLHLGLPIHRLHFGSWLPRNHRGPSFHQLHRAPSSLRLRLGQSSPCLLHGTPLFQLCLIPPSVRLLPPSSSTFVLCHSGSAVAFRIPAWAAGSA